MKSFAFRVLDTTHLSDRRQHVRVQIFAGPEGGTRASCGMLTMLVDEAAEFVDMLCKAGAEEAKR